MPSCSRLRQRLDELASLPGVLERVDALNVDLLARSSAPVGALHTGHVALAIDGFTMDHSNTHKEGVARTYAGFDGDSPIAAYSARKAGASAWSGARDRSIRPRRETRKE